MIDKDVYLYVVFFFNSQHEMIHAYLFVLNIREGNGGHGPNFKRIMESINRTAGTNITVYHTFHDEVALYKTHIWRCNGIWYTNFISLKTKNKKLKI